jgi:hypothetical protein
MAFDLEQRQARRILDGLELGSMEAADSFALIEDADPALVHVIISWLRERYATHSAAEGVIGRIVELCRRHPATVRILKKGAADSLVQWFEDTYEYRDLDADELVELIVEKLES